MIDKEGHVQIIGVSGTEYNLPATLFERIADGETDVDEIQNRDDILPIIIRDWLDEF